jgi:hypothetical protein|tara:strand:+ start:294 stop:503 length:210 start_codon:yes stop_codon:yes gene_type:complete
MKTILTSILSLFIFFGAVPSVNAQEVACANTCEMSSADEIKKKKKKKKKKGAKGKKKKKGFFSKAFGSK